MEWRLPIPASGRSLQHRFRLNGFARNRNQTPPVAGMSAMKCWKSRKRLARPWLCINSWCLRAAVLLDRPYGAIRTTGDRPNFSAGAAGTNRAGAETVSAAQTSAERIDAGTWEAT